MIKIRLDLSQFKPEMDANKAKVPEALRLIRRGVALVVQRGAKEELYPGHGLISGKLRLSVRLTPKAHSIFVEPHRDYSTWIERGGIHPSSGRMTSFRGYGYMKIGAEKGAAEAPQIASTILARFFRG